jgi:hypothetical protein
MAAADRLHLQSIALEARRSVLPRSWESVVARFESVISEALVGEAFYASPVPANP